MFKDIPNEMSECVEAPVECEGNQVYNETTGEWSDPNQIGKKTSLAELKMARMARMTQMEIAATPEPEPEPEPSRNRNPNPSQSQNLNRS